jgi:uncharacterized protein (TIRG00374 family)
MNGARSWMGRIFAGVALAILCYAVLVALTGWSDLTRQLGAFPLRYVPFLLAFSLSNYGLRFLRWEILLRRLDVRIPLRDSAAIFFATFIMVITPGKIGEAFKAGFLWERHGLSLARGLPVVLAERLFDFLAVFLLACGGLLFWRGTLSGMSTAILVASLLPLLLVALRSHRVRSWLLRRASRASYFQRHQVVLADATEALARLLGGRPLPAVLLLSCAAWAAECLSLWLVSRGCAAPLPLADAFFIYAAGTLVGSLSFLPGGLGGTEGTIIWLLTESGVTATASVTVALVVRVATLWLALLIGLGVFLAFRRLFLAGRSAPAAGPSSSGR